MKKLILLLAAVPLLFASCEKEGEKPTPEPTPQVGVQLARTFENIGNRKWYVRSKTTQLYVDSKCVYTNTINTPTSTDGFAWALYSPQPEVFDPKVYNHMLGHHPADANRLLYSDGVEITWDKYTGRVKFPESFSDKYKYNPIITSLTKDEIVLSRVSDPIVNKGRNMWSVSAVKYSNEGAINIDHNKFKEIATSGYDCVYVLTVINNSSHTLKFVRNDAPDPYDMFKEFELKPGQSTLSYQKCYEKLMYTIYDTQWQPFSGLAYMQIDDDKMLANEVNPYCYPVTHSDVAEYYGVQPDKNNPILSRYNNYKTATYTFTDDDLIYAEPLKTE